MFVLNNWPSRARAAGLMVAAAVAFGVAGCTSTGSDSAAVGDAGSQSEAAMATAEAAPSAGGSADSAGGGGSPAAAAAGETSLSRAPLDTAKIIRTADLSVRLDVAPVTPTAENANRDADAAARADAAGQAAATVRSIATAAGGYQASADGGGAQVTIGLRVPAERYGGVVEKIAAAGTVTERTESSRDVTAQSADVDSRVESMTASVARVRALLARAGSVADVISIESELAVREADLESLQQQKAALDGQVALSSITVTLRAVTTTTAGTTATEPDSGFVAGLAAGWAALRDLLGWAGGAAGVLLPFLPLLIAGAVLVWFLLRRLRRSRSVRKTVQPAIDSRLQAAATHAEEPEPVGAAAGGPGRVGAGQVGAGHVGAGPVGAGQGVPTRGERPGA